MIEHCISALSQFNKEKSYQLYITECLRMITENTARFGGGSYMQLKYSELIEPKPQDNRTADEIIQGIKTKVNNLNKN